MDTQKLPCRGKESTATTLDNLGISKFSHLEIPTQYRYLIGTRILVPTGKFCDTNIDVDHENHAFTYTLDQHWLQRVQKLICGIEKK